MTLYRKQKESNMIWRIDFDGGATPNPGRGSCAYRAFCHETSEVLSKSWAMRGRNNTNNQAEWEAIITGLEHLMTTKEKVTKVEVYGDSQLVIEQLNGRYKVSSNRLRPYYKRWLTLKDKYPDVVFSFTHVLRENNSHMDAACKSAR
jgi:ribonuclease HI